MTTEPTKAAEAKRLIGMGGTGKEGRRGTCTSRRGKGRRVEEAPGEKKREGPVK